MFMGRIVKPGNQEKKLNNTISGTIMGAAILEIKMAVLANSLTHQFQNVILMVNAPGKDACLVTKNKMSLF